MPRRQPRARLRSRLGASFAVSASSVLSVRWSPAPRDADPRRPSAADQRSRVLAGGTRVRRYADPVTATSLWHPFADMAAVMGDELVLVRGEGVHVWDDAGNRYLD